jgi:hypothetical protein
VVWCKAYGHAKTPCDRWALGVHMARMLATHGKEKMLEWLETIRVQDMET